MMRARALVVIVLLSGVAALSAHAEPAAPAPAPGTPEAEVEAKRLYQDATKSFQLGEFGPAIEGYKAAYKLVPKPFFIYNIAQAYRLMGDFKQALFFYRSFLNALPDASNRAEVEGRITDLEAQLAKQAETVKAPPNGPANPDTPPVKIPGPDTAAATTSGTDSAPPAGVPSDSGRKPIYKKWWFWAGIGAVAIGATVAVVAASSGGGNSEPSSSLGTTPIF